MLLEHLLQETVILLAGAVLVSLLAVRLRIPPLVGLLLAGMVIGPSGLGWVAEIEAVEAFAEIGVALLLFTIGLELSLAELKELRRVFLAGGGLQAALTIGAVAAATWAFVPSPGSAIFLGCAVALSSTAIVLKLLGERGESDSPHGRVSLGILLFQDFLIVPLIVLTPVLGGEVPLSVADLALRFGGSLLVVGVVVLAARKLVPAFFLRLARTRARETFVLGALLSCLAMAWLTHALGFSLALGAFLAGLIVSETEYSDQVIADVGPFRDLFSSLFFISIGMLVDLRFAAGKLALLLALAVGIIVVKTLAASVAVAAAGFPGRTRLLAALGLSQVGEFSFVLMEVGRRHGLLGDDGFQLLLSAAVLTILATPLLLRLAPWLADRLPLVAPPVSPPGEDRSGHVVVVGYGLGGRLLARELREAHIPYVVIELSVEIQRRAREHGEPVLYGDATRPEILSHAGVPKARVVVFTISDPAALRRAVTLARRLNPTAEIVVRTRRVGEIEELRGLGADEVVAEEFETAIEIFTLVLRRYHVPRNVIRAQTRVLRGEGYAMLRTPALGAGVSEAVLDALAAGTTEIFQLAPGSPAAGRSLRELDLRHRTGATVIAVVRGEVPNPNPAPDTVLEGGDCLVLVGSHEEIDRAFTVLAAALDGPAPGSPG
ncbi:MAG: cation:proton antiporter [Acidobacteria bacterium]|nr:cation:proton antiporter [Acidobacteriota bacterium]